MVLMMPESHEYQEHPQLSGGDYINLISKQKAQWNNKKEKNMVKGNKTLHTHTNLKITVLDRQQQWSVGFHWQNYYFYIVWKSCGWHN